MQKYFRAVLFILLLAYGAAGMSIGGIAEVFVSPDVDCSTDTIVNAIGNAILFSLDVLRKQNQFAFRNIMTGNVEYCDLMTWWGVILVYKETLLQLSMGVPGWICMREFFYKYKCEIQPNDNQKGKRKQLSRTQVFTLQSRSNDVVVRAGDYSAATRGMLRFLPKSLGRLLAPLTMKLSAGDNAEDFFPEDSALSESNRKIYSNLLASSGDGNLHLYDTRAFPNGVITPPSFMRSLIGLIRKVQLKEAYPGALKAILFTESLGKEATSFPLCIHFSC
jgi:hypothetical protein